MNHDTNKHIHKWTGVGISTNPNTFHPYLITAVIVCEKCGEIRKQEI